MQRTCIGHFHEKKNSKLQKFTNNLAIKAEERLKHRLKRYNGVKIVANRLFQIK
jgi:hypothetical protein